MYFDVLIYDQHNQTGKLTLASSAKESEKWRLFFSRWQQDGWLHDKTLDTTDSVNI